MALSNAADGKIQLAPVGSMVAIDGAAPVAVAHEANVISELSMVQEGQELTVAHIAKLIEGE